MSSDGIQSTISKFLLYLQACLGAWQFIKLTPGGALIKGVFGWLIKGVFGWLLRPLRLSTTYIRLQDCGFHGRVFKKANCFELQADIRTERRDIQMNQVNSIDVNSIDLSIDVNSIDLNYLGSNPTERRDIQMNQVNSIDVNNIDLNYLGSNFVLERKKEKEEDGDTLYVRPKDEEGDTNVGPKDEAGNTNVGPKDEEGDTNVGPKDEAGDTNVGPKDEAGDTNVGPKEEDGDTYVAPKIKYYITDMIWKELQNLRRVLHYGDEGPPTVRAAVTRAVAESLKKEHANAKAKAQHADVKAQHAERIKTAGPAVKCNSAYYNVTYGVPAEAATDARAAAAKYTFTANDYVTRTTTDADRAVEARQKAAEAARTASNDALKAADDALRTADSVKASDAASRATLFVKGKKDFWKETITGGVMTLEEVMDAIILYNQHVSVRLSNDSLLPINLSVSGETLLKLVNLVGLILQTRKVVKVHWLIPAVLSLISALLEISAIRVRLYSMINVVFCYIMHLMCDPLPRSWRRHVYSLGKWVENLTPCNDIQLKVVRGNMCAIITEGAKLKVVRGNMCAIITEGAKVDKEGAKVEPWVEMTLTPLHGLIEKNFHCAAIGSDIRCTFVKEPKLCEIHAPHISEFYVKCKDEDEFRRIITLVKLMAEKCCGSLISYGPNNKVRVRGFEQSVTSFVDNGFPSVYTLDLENVIVA